MEDCDIVELYKNRSERAIDETKKKYGQYCRYIIKRIVFVDEDVDEVENDVYMKLWITVPTASFGSFKSYVGLVSRTLAINTLDKNTAAKRQGGVQLIFEELSECIPDKCLGMDMVDGMALRDALNKFVRSLPEKNARIFVRRYWYACPVDEIADEYGMSENNVAVLLHRTRKKLKKHLNKEGFIV